MIRYATSASDNSPEKYQDNCRVAHDSCEANDRYVGTNAVDEPVRYRVDDVPVAQPVRMKIQIVVVAVARQRPVAADRTARRWSRSVEDDVDDGVIATAREGRVADVVSADSIEKYRRRGDTHPDRYLVDALRRSSDDRHLSHPVRNAYVLD